MRYGFFLTLIGLLGFVAESSGQSTTLTYGQQLDALNSAKKLELFLRQFPQQYSYTAEVDSTQQGLKEYCQCNNVQVPPAWVRADLDGDGRLDILLAGEDDDGLAVLNRGAALPEFIELRIRGYSRWCRTYTAGRVGKRAVIHGQEFAALSKNQKAKGEAPQQWKFTLMYQSGAFVDYVVRPRKMLPRHLAYRYRRGGPPRPGLAGYDLLLNTKTGAVTGSQNVFGDSTAIREFEYQLTAAQLDTLRNRLRFLQIRKLKKGYSASAYDMSSAYVTLFYQWRRKKVIRDYGMRGKHSLVVIYNFLDGIQKREIARLQAEKHSSK